MTMKLGGDMLLVEIFTNWEEVWWDPRQFGFMMSSSFWCVATDKKVEGFLGLLLNIQKMPQLIFTKLMLCFRQSSVVLFEIKDWRQDISCCHGNQFIGECWAKDHEQREENDIFLKILCWYYIFELRFKPKITPCTKFWLNSSDNKEAMKTFPF